MRRLWLLAIAACAAPSEQAAIFARAGEGLKAVEASSGDLRLKCEPLDSEVWLDGMPVGACEDFAGRRGLSLGQRMRKVEVRKDGYTPYLTFVEPDGTHAALTVTLLPSNTGGGP